MFYIDGYVSKVSFRITADNINFHLLPVERMTAYGTDENAKVGFFMLDNDSDSKSEKTKNPKAKKEDEPKQGICKAFDDKNSGIEFALPVAKFQIFANNIVACQYNRSLIRVYIKKSSDVPKNVESVEILPY